MAAKQKLVRRIGAEQSQTLRRGIQALFLALNVSIGVEFYRWVRYFETGGQSPFAERPAGVEGWLPIASLMNLKVWIETGALPRVHPAGMFLFLAFFVMSWVFRKSFCSWLCPVGTISEYLWRLGRKALGRNFRLPRRLDVPLRGLKYLLLGLFLCAVGSLSAGAISMFLGGPYGLVDDVRMLNFFRTLGSAGVVVMAVLTVASLLVENFWCRYLCPYGALMGLVGMASPVRIRRDEPLCIDCAKCAKACPAALPVDRLVTIQSAECTACMACVASCPAEGALMLSAPARHRIPAWAVALGVAAIFLGVCGYAQWTGRWRTNLPERAYWELVPRANEFSHP